MFNCSYLTFVNTLVNTLGLHVILYLLYLFFSLIFLHVLLNLFACYLMPFFLLKKYFRSGNLLSVDFKSRMSNILCLTISSKRNIFDPEIYFPLISKSVCSMLLFKGRIPIFLTISSKRNILIRKFTFLWFQNSDVQCSLLEEENLLICLFSNFLTSWSWSLLLLLLSFINVITTAYFS